MEQRNSLETKAEQTSWQGEPAVHFCAGGYEALMIPGIGANVIELKDTVRGLNLLRTPKDAESFKARPQVYGIPVLFPPNRIEDGTFEAAGKVYHFPVNEVNRNNHIHGFLHTRPWKVTKIGAVSKGIAEVEVTYKADSTSDFYNYFPHEFECKLLYRLSSAGLKQTISITNNSSSPMPMGLGYHTAFSVPFHPESTGEDYRMWVSVNERWELSERILPTGKRLPLTEKEMSYRNQGMPPLGDPIDKHYTVLPLNINGKEFHGAILEDTSKGLRLVYEVGKGFKHWMLWNMDGNSGFVCPEPQTWVVNAPNVKLPDEITGMKLLAPGETWEETCKIFVQEI